MQKIDYKKKMEKLKKRAKKSGMGNEKENSLEYQTTSEKICPFMSTPEADRACTSRCKFYRPEKKNYECYFMVLQTISWFMKKLTDEEEEEKQ